MTGLIKNGDLLLQMGFTGYLLVWWLHARSRLMVGYDSVTRGKCSGACFALAATRWISSELLMVRPGPLVDQAMWVAVGVVLGGSRLLAVEVRYGGAGCDDRGRRCYVSREWC